MPRTITTAMKAAITAQGAEAVELFQLAFSGGSLYLTNGAFSITWNGHTFLALGGQLTYEGLGESGDLSSGAVSVVAAGVDTTLVATILTNGYIGQAANIWLAAFDPTTALVIADPLPLFTGYMNGGITIEETYTGPGEGPGTCTVRVGCTSRLALLDQRRGIQANLGSHQSLYPGDQFFRYAGANIGAKVIWQNT